MVTTHTAEAHYAFELSGGRLCLDFVNTVSNRGSEAPVDHLRSYGDFLSFCEQAHAVPAALLRQLAKEAAAHPAAARSALSQAVAVREALFHVFDAISAGRRPRPVDLAVVNEHVPAAFARSRVTADADRYTLIVDAADGDLLSPLAPIVKSAVDLLTSADVDRVRACAAETCEWLFMDTTKNRTRRWCAMKVCGNREKVRRFRSRAS